MPLRAWHSNYWDDEGVLFESALATPFGRLVLVADGEADCIIEE